MGADLYIMSLHTESMREFEPKFNEAAKKRDALPEGASKDKAQKKVTEFYNKMNGQGYFRDPYNGTSVLNALQLSWWKDVIPMLDSGRSLTPDKTKKLITRIKKAKLPIFTAEELSKNNCYVDQKDTVQSWNEYFKDKKNSLVAFLELAIELGENVECSL